jgi:hypothetical protein
MGQRSGGLKLLQCNGVLMMKKLAVAGWIMSLAGTALWAYGYFSTGTPPFFNWDAVSPWWIAEWLPNSESEIGSLLTFVGMIPIYWPSGR